MPFQNRINKAGFWTDFSPSGSILAFHRSEPDSFWQSFLLKMPDTGIPQRGFRGIPNKSETTAYLATTSRCVTSQLSAVFPDPTAAEVAPAAIASEPHLVSSGLTVSAIVYKSISALSITFRFVSSYNANIKKSI